MIATAERLKQERKMPYKASSSALRTSYASLMRYRRRSRLGQSLVGKPGPSKVKPLQVQSLKESIRHLTFCPRRTLGTAELYERFRDSVSRRDLRLFINEMRMELRGLQESLERRVQWRWPGAVWSIDDTLTALLPNAQGMIHLLYDLGGRYNLRALGSETIAHGDQVAQNLEELFERVGVPLFLKRDNGSNLNHWRVNEVLGRRGVIPLNSPVYYPPYNGAIEREQAELKKRLFARVGEEPLNKREYRLECEMAAQELNHRRRRVLDGRMPCQALEAGLSRLRGVYNRRKREEVFNTIKAMAVDITRLFDKNGDIDPETSFRYAAETWMQQNSLIRVTFNGKVSPH